jgi:hypothetical protein
MVIIKTVVQDDSIQGKTIVGPGTFNIRIKEIMRKETEVLLALDEVEVLTIKIAVIVLQDTNFGVHQEIMK